LKRKIKIFLSHRHEDFDTALRIKEILDSVTGAAEVFLSENIVRGADWRIEVKKQLATTDFLLLLYTDPDANWDWCFYEAGLFEDLKRHYSPAHLSGADEDERFRTICLLSHAVDVPGPMQNFQSTVANPRDPSAVKQLLLQIFVRQDPIRQLWAAQRSPAGPSIDQMAQDIANAVGKTDIGSNYPAKIAILTISDPSQCDGVTIPATARIRSPDNGKSLEMLFGREVRGRLNEGLAWNVLQWKDWSQGRWVDELAHMLPSVAAGHVYSPLGSPHQRDDAQTIYDPILYRVERFASGAIACHILFSDRAGRSAAITSFTDLMHELTRLITSAPKNDSIRFLAYTPALGFLAQPANEWEKLKQALTEKAGQLFMTCLAHKPLEEWHRRFLGRPTRRADCPIGDALIDEANQLSSVLTSTVEKRGTLVELEWRDLPQFYLFTSSQRSIYVVPFGLPRLDNKGSPSGANVEMFGVVTEASDAIINAQKLYAAHSTPSGRRFTPPRGSRVG